MMSSTHSAHRLGVIVAACLLGGCANFGGDAVWVYEIAKSELRGGDDVTFQEAAAVPYASMGIRLGGGSQIMLLLATDSDGRQLWTSAARISITTQNGRITRTAGLGHDLDGYELRKHEPTENGAFTRLWQADFSELGAYSVPIACMARPSGEETITILGKDIRTLRLVENCEAIEHSLNWSFKNTYWLDPTTGLVWRSIQHVNPRLDAIELEILRPPA